MKEENNRNKLSKGNNKKAGKYPFTGGIYKGMYTEKLWTMRQYSGMTSATESNKRYKYLIEKGVSGLSIAFDLPTQIGYDSDHIMAEGEVGKVGVPISTIDDMELLFNGIDLGKISTSMTINSTAGILLAFYISIAEKKGVALSKIKGTIQNDVLKEYIARGTYIYPPKPSLRIITDIFEFCSNHIPKWNSISISGYHIREAGSTATEELAFTFANAITYVESAIKKGLDPNIFGSRISFFFNSHNGFLEEIAKFRAARKIWATIMRERFSVTNEKAMLCRFHVQTGGSTLTAQQVSNNSIRTSIQALSAILGGAQSLHTNAFDEALALPTENSAKQALRTQQIIAHETNITQYIDPLNGSDAIDSLTIKFVKETNELIKKIDEMGGAINAIEKGWIQNKIALSAFNYQQSIDNKDKLVVGVNSFIENDSDIISKTQKINQASVKGQIDRLKKIKSKRNNNKVAQKLLNIKNATSSGENLMPLFIDAVKAYCTLGEISDVLRESFGEYQAS